MSADKKIPYTQLPTADNDNDTVAPPPAYEAAASSSSSSNNGKPANLGAELQSLMARTAEAVRNHPTVIFAQPTSRNPMSLTTGERNAKGLEVGQDGRRDWTHSLCACHETPGQFASAFCCPCFVYAQNRERLMELNATGEPVKSPSLLSLPCALYTVAPNFFGLGQALMQCFSRLQTRERYAIRGDIVQDAFISGLCVPCALVQESREIQEEEQALRQGSMSANDAVMEGEASF